MDVKYILRSFKIFLILWAMLVVFTSAARGDAPSREYEVKAAMICNFAQFVEWPGDAFESESSPLVVEVVGNNPFGDALDQVAANKRVGGRAIVVNRVKTADKIEPCHILFVANNQEANLAAIMEKVRGRAVLTLGECDSFPWSGGIIRFYTSEGKIRFEANVKAAEAARLKISSKLLKLARIFDPQK